MKEYAYSEVYDIVEHLEPNLYERIPQKIIEALKTKIDVNYESNIDYSKSINEQNISYEAKVLLSLIYREFICDEDLKNKLRKYDWNELNKNDYFDNLFNKKENTITVIRNEQQEEIQNESNVSLVEYKESLFHRILKKLKVFFKADCQ